MSKIQDLLLRDSCCNTFSAKTVHGYASFDSESVLYYTQSLVHAIEVGANQFYLFNRWLPHSFTVVPWQAITVNQYYSYTYPLKNNRLLLLKEEFNKAYANHEKWQNQKGIKSLVNYSKEMITTLLYSP